jgi:hypothetical protein
MTITVDISEIYKMKISKLILELNEIKNRLGDIDVMLPQTNDAGTESFKAKIDVIEVDTEKDGTNVVVIY